MRCFFMTYFFIWNILYWRGKMFDTYVVKVDDTLDEIAKMFKVTPQILKDINGDVKVGDSILIPKITNDYFDYYKVNKGDTLYKIARDNLLNPKLLAMLNGINVDDYIYPNEVLLLPRAGSMLYFVREGDTLNEVAKEMNISVSELITQNKTLYLQPEQLIVYKYQ